jgi:hypothetical protein
VTDPDALPPPPRPLDHQVRSAMLRGLRPELHRRRRSQLRQGRPRLRGVTVGFVLAGVAVTGATTFAAFRSAPDEFVHCYSKESRDFSASFPGTSVMVTGEPRPDPVDQCALVWRDAILRPGLSGPQVPDPGRPRTEIPRLEACVAPDGTAAVFPGRAGACARLGLPRYVREES